MRQRLLFGLMMYFIWAGTAAAQSNFSSGSTGADGAFSPTTSQTITVPASGVFNYTTVTIPSTVTITYVRNAANTPLTVLASGDVQISGSLVLDGQPGSSAGFGGLGGPGAFAGGSGGLNGAAGAIADGPGGGRGGPISSDLTNCAGGSGGGYQLPGSSSGGVSTGCSSNGLLSASGGSIYGSRTIVPLLGGSGGGGGCGFGQRTGGGGGGGGGAILIASSTTISFTGGVIAARGGSGGSVGCGIGAGGGGGSGGAIRLIANTITGNGQLLTTGGPGQTQGGTGGTGYIRVEAFSLSGLNVGAALVSSGLPTSVTPANTPTLRIASVAGVAAPTVPSGSFQGSPDVVLPANQANPVAVVINGTNIPTGTTVNLTATTATGSSTTATTTLAGTTSSSSGTASISLAAGLSVLTATTIIDLAQTGELRPMFINGEKIEKIEVAARYGGGSEVTYITQTGHRIRSLQ